MAHYARLENNVAVEFIDTDDDISTLYPPEMVWMEASVNLQAGWVYNPITASFSAPVVLLDPTWRQQLWDQFRVRRDVYLSRLSDIAGRYQRKGIASVPPAADAIAEGLLAMPEDPQYLTATDPDSLHTAVVVACNNLLRAQLTDPATAPGIKAALDKVFK